MKDKIIEMISSQTDMKERFEAIEFMIELCLILKNLQFQPNMMGNGAGSFLYGSGGMGGFNSRQVIEQLNQVNLIGLLAQSLSIFTPNEETLKVHLKYLDPKDKPKIVDMYKKKNPSMEESVIEELLEIKNEDDLSLLDPSHKEEGSLGTTRLDQMKVNSLEIIITFY